MGSITRRRVIAALAAGTLTAGCLAEEPEEPHQAVVHQSPTCACCDAYVEYLEEELGVTVSVEETDDMAAVKDTFDIPSTLESCHTLEYRDFVFEGHLPAAVIEAFLEEPPAVPGIALPGMPAGSPGMGGSKDEEWTVYTLDEDQSVYTTY